MMNRIGLWSLTSSDDLLRSKWEVSCVRIPWPRVGTLEKVNTDVILPSGGAAFSLLPWVVHPSSSSFGVVQLSPPPAFEMVLCSLLPDNWVVLSPCICCVIFDIFVKIKNTSNRINLLLTKTETYRGKEAAPTKRRRKHHSTSPAPAESSEGGGWKAPLPKKRREKQHHPQGGRGKGESRKQQPAQRRGGGTQHQPPSRTRKAAPPTLGEEESSTIQKERDRKRSERSTTQKGREKKAPPTRRKREECTATQKEKGESSTTPKGGGKAAPHTRRKDRGRCCVSSPPSEGCCYFHSFFDGVMSLPPPLVWRCCLPVLLWE